MAVARARPLTASRLFNSTQRAEQLAVGQAIVDGTHGKSKDGPTASSDTLAPAARAEMPDAALATAIVSSNVPELVEGIKSHRWTSVQLLLVFIRRSLEVQAATNALTEPMYAEALALATKLDDEFAKTGQLVGPRA